MKKLFWIFSALLVAVAIGFVVRHDPGYVMMTYQHWMVAMSFWTAAVAYIISVIVLYYVIRFLKNIFGLKRFFSKRHRLLSALKYRKWMNRGLYALGTGHFSVAEKCFIKASRKTPLGYLQYLFAATISVLSYQFKKGYAYIEKAAVIKPDKKFLILLTKSHLFVAEEKYEEAIKILQTLLPEDPKNPLLLRLIKTTATHYLQQLLQQKSFDAFKVCWEKLPTSVQMTPDLAVCYARYCAENALLDESKIFIEQCLKHVWFPALLYYYASDDVSRAPDVVNRIKVAEHWLKLRNDNADVLLVLAKLCIYANFPGKARTYAERCISLNPHKNAYSALGAACEMLGDHGAALKHYRKGICYT